MFLFSPFDNEHPHTRDFNLDSIDYLITDQPPAEKHTEFSRENKIAIVVAK